MPAAAIGFIGGMFSFGAGAAFAAGGAAFSGWVAGASFAGTLLGGLSVKLLSSVALSALAGAMQSEPPQGGGLTISTTVRGEQNPETIILGTYATSGQAICAPYSHGESNKYLTHVIELCSAPGAQISRILLGEEWVQLTSPFYDASFGRTVSGDKYGGNVWVQYYDGTQTAADPYLLAKYGDHPDRPWQVDMVGTGLCYAVLTFKYEEEDLPQVPRYRFEMTGLPLYDLRRDSSTGGNGTQRLDNPSTWGPTQNPIVMVWNIMRGIPLPGGDVYGGNIRDLRNLPRAAWIAAMNRCDQPVTLSDDRTEPMYRAGLEISLDQPPAAAIEELLKACAGTIADLGYGWGILAGAPSLPVYAFTDEDVIVSRQQELDPFPGLQDTYNAVSAKFPDRTQLWETKEAPQRTNVDLETSDAFGRRMASLSLPAVPFSQQVQRLMRAWIEDERRFRRHVISLPPDAAHAELTETVDWSSQRNGYDAKAFSIHEIVEDPRTAIRQFSLRERNPNDYSWTPTFELPTPPSPPAVPVIVREQVSGFSVQAAVLTDEANAPRRPAIRISWNPELLARALRWEIRLAGSLAVALRGSIVDLSAGEAVVIEGILPATNYEVRARLVKSRRTEWTPWRAVRTPDVRIGSGDIDDTPPGLITGLQLASTLGELTASWNASTASDVAYYDIELTEAGSNSVSFQTPLARHRWSPVRPNVAFSARVRAVDRRGNSGPWSDAATHTTARDTVPPAVPSGLGIRTGFGTFLLSWNRNTEADFSHYEIYEHATTTNPTAGTEPTYVSPSNTASLTGYADGTTRNFWVRAVDTSDNKSAWATRVQGRTASLTDLGDPAALPTGLATSTRLSSDTAFVAVTWAAAANAVSYEIGITQANGNEVVFPVGELAYEFVALKGVSYSIRVRGVNSLGRRSNWTAAQVRVAAVDTIAPAVPGTPVLTAGFNTIWAEWPRATEADFSHYEIAAAPGGFTAAAAPGNIIGTTRTNSVALTEIPDGQSRFMRIRAVDTSGNASGWSAAAGRRVVALPDVTITSAKLEGLINATSFAAGIEPVRIISTGPLPTALTTNAIIWGGKFYRWNGTEYTASTAVTDLEGRITAAQIAVGAVRAEQVDAGAITASKLAIGDFSNLVGDNDYQDVAAWSGAMAQSHVTLNTTYGTNVASANSKGALMIYPPANRGVSTSVTGAWVTCEPDAQFYAQGTIAATDGPISAYVWLQFADKDGVILDSPRSAIKTTQGFEDMPLTATAPANSRQVRYIVTVAANGYANGHVVFSGPVLRRRNGGELIIDGALRARHVAAEEFITLSAQIKDAIITDAHVSNLSAAKLTAGTALAATITVSGEALSSIRGKAAQGAQDPAVRINEGSTVIDPGRIRISGTTTLDDWRGGSDQTEINGGRIATDTISARSIQLIDTSTIIPDANFQDPASWSSHSGAALSFGVDASPNMGTIGGRRIVATINPAHTTTSQYSGIESSPFPVQRLVEYAIRNMIWTSGLATVRVDISWRDRLNVEIGSSAITPAGASGWREVAGTVTAPTNAVAGVYRILIRGDAAVGTNLILARPHVNRLVDQLLIQDRSITGAKLIATEEVITASAQIKDAIITNAHVVDLSAAKLMAGTAMASSITVDGRSMASLNGDYLFDDTSITWPKLQGAGTFYKSNPVMFGVTGGSTQVMNANGLQWLESNEMIPYDPNKLYRVTFSIRRGDSGTTGGCYLGLNGWNNDRTQRVNTAGADAYANQHWFPEVFNRPQSAVPTGFTEYVCYYKGKNDDPTGANAGAGTVASPRRMHTNVRYVKPAAIFNFNLASGGTTMVLNHCKIEVVGEEAAELVNAGSTQIEPGLIRVTGSTTLADWRKGGDETRIDGGMLSANTVRANALEIGSRNVTLTGIRFEHNDPSANRVSWTGGQVRWVNDNNVPVTSTITANNALWTSGVLYIYWVKGETVFRTTTSQAVAFATNNLILATYQGNIALDADYGRTIIDGAEIRTGTIRAAQLVKTAALITDSAQLGNATVDTLSIAGNAVNVPAGAKGAVFQSGGATAWRVLVSVPVLLTQRSPISINWAIRHTYFEGLGFGYYGFRVELNGVIIEQKDENRLANDFPSGNAFGMGNVGSNTVRLLWRGWESGRFDAQGSIVAVGIQR